MTMRYAWSALRRRLAETLAAGLAVALTVAFLAALGSFVAQTGSRLTVKAAARVPVDWQVQVSQGSDPQAVRAALQKVPGLVAYRAVEYASVPGLRSTSATGARTTGTAYVVSLPPDYASFAPSEVRALLGSGQGPVLQQQTAANLASAPGSIVSVIGSAGSVRISGVVDLPNADSFFQVVGAPSGAGATAPPDNVLLVPPSLFPALVGHAAVVHQLHVRLDHTTLPADPAKALDQVTQRVNHFVAAVAGGALVGDDLGRSLSAAREDALYARLLVLLLGLPALVLSVVVTSLVIALRNDRQRRDLALLRLRGATPGRSGVLLGIIALSEGLLGAALGTGGALVATRLALGAGARLSLRWLLMAAGVGVLVAVLTELAPVARLLRAGSPSVREGQSGVVSSRTPLPLRLGLDAILLAASGLVFWLTSRGGYQVVLVPEGVPVASVNYAGLLAPALAWPGLALLVWRLTAMALARRGKPPVSDPAGRLNDLRRDVLRQRRRAVARGATGLAIAFAVTLSAAVFTTTYDQQARVDTALTVGSDVAVTVAPDSLVSLSRSLAKVPGVRAVEQVSHRLAYVGPDLQDLYAIDPRTIGRAAPLADAFTPGSSVRAVLKRLAATPDGALLSQETLHDYQLHVGDLIRLRLKGADGRYVTVPFHVAGVVTEFATAPRDSFVVANHDFVTRRTGMSAVQTLLIRTDHPKQVAARIKAPVGALVNDITAPRVAVPSASGLAAGSLAGLARLTLAFGSLLAAASAGLVLIVSAGQRRQALVAMAVLGATARQRASFLWTEARAITLAGLIGGVVAGSLVAFELVKLLTGIFDPPPSHPAVPWGLVCLLTGVVVATGALATVGAARWAGRVDPSRLRDA